ATDPDDDSVVGFDSNGELLGPLAKDESLKVGLAATRAGDRIAYVRRLDGILKRFDVVTMARDGSDKKIATLDFPKVADAEKAARTGAGRPLWRYESLSFSPDGSSIVLFCRQEAGKEGIFRLASDGRSLDLLVGKTRFQREVAPYRSPSLSPDGK